MNVSTKITFIVPQVVPYVRTTQKQKYYDPQYKKYQQYKKLVQTCYLQAVSKFRLKYSENPEPTGTISLRVCLTRLTKQPTKMTDNAGKGVSYLKVTIESID